MIEEARKPIISPAVLSQEVNGETVLLDLKGERYFGLNEVGTRIWQLLRLERDTHEILEALSDEFDVPRDRLERDIRALFDRMARAGIIRFA